MQRQPARGSNETRQVLRPVELLLHPVQRGIEDFAPARVARGKERLLATGQRHPGLRHINAADLLPVLHQILQVVEDLQRGAKPVRGGVSGLARHTMQAQQHPAHRVGAAGAVMLQSGPIGIARLMRILAKRLEHQHGFFGADAARMHGSGLGEGGCWVSQRLAHRIQPAQFFGRVKLRAISNVIGHAHEAVEGHHLAAHRLRQDQRGGGEILRVMVTVGAPGGGFGHMPFVAG